MRLTDGNGDDDYDELMHFMVAGIAMMMAW